MSDRYDLIIPNNLSKYSIWNKYLNRCLAVSGIFNVKEDAIKQIEWRRRWRTFFSIIKLNGLFIGIDTWDGDGPTTWGSPQYKEFSLIMKIQYEGSPLYETVAKKYNVNLKITSWTMFGYDEFPAGWFHWKNENHKHLMSFSGHPKGTKTPWINYMKSKGMPTNGRISKEAHLGLLKATKWGVILHGYPRPFSDLKNRRESLFSSCGIPLALNYKPNYPWGMMPGIDYVYLEKPEDLQKLEGIDPKPFAERSTELWEKRFSPKGMAETLIEIIKNYGFKF